MYYFSLLVMVTFGKTQVGNSDTPSFFSPTLLTTQGFEKSGLHCEKFVCLVKCCPVGPFIQSWEMS